VSIRLQEFPHCIFLFHGRLLTSSANLRVASTSVRLQSCFIVICAKSCGNGILMRSHPTTSLKKTNSYTTFAGHDEGCKSAFPT